MFGVVLRRAKVFVLNFACSIVFALRVCVRSLFQTTRWVGGCLSVFFARHYSYCNCVVCGLCGIFAYGVVGSIEWAEKKGGVAHKLAEQAFKIWKLKEKISPDSANWIPRVMQHNSS